MNKDWTKEHTRLSVIKQKKAIFIILPVIMALVVYIDRLNNQSYNTGMQGVIKELCQDADFLKYHSSSLCDIESIQIDNQGEIYLFSCENENTCLS